MTDNLLAKKPEPIGIIRPKMPENCGTCQFSDMNPQDIKMIICKGLPPQMLVVGMTQAGPNIMPCYPNLPRVNPPCALHRPRGPQGDERAN